MGQDRKVEHQNRKAGKGPEQAALEKEDANISRET